jgi:NAD(P)-dependent dehydrogenase (short-subunit alcohol dehydrogenase family)
VRLNAAKVILAVRTISKGDAAKADIIRSTGASDKTIEVWELDLSRYASVVAFGQRVRTLERLDAVVQNAGIQTQQFRMVEGHESTITVNSISAVLLGLEVLPKLKESARAFHTRGRLTFVGSDMVYGTEFKEQDVPGRKLFEALNDPKIANMEDRQVLSEMKTRDPLQDGSDWIADMVRLRRCCSTRFGC